MPSPRSLLWIASLLLALCGCVAWGQLPSLQSHGLLRVGLFAAIGLSMLGMVFFFPNASGRRSLTLLLAAVVLRVALLPAPHSDDVHRYLWEGKLVLAGENPYAAIADDPIREPFRDEHWFAMNHRDKPTPYPPGIQWIMAAAKAVSYHPWVCKALALIGDLASLLILLRLMKLESAPLRWAGFYAFNPVVLIGFAAEAHFDSLMTAALLGALLFHRMGRFPLAWLMIGAAIQIKFVCIVLAPLFLGRRSWRSAWCILPILLLPSLPFHADLDSWWKGVTTFGGGGLFNSPVMSLFYHFEWYANSSRKLAAPAFLLIACLALTARLRGWSLIDACLLVMGALLLLSPIVHFWYLAWLIPLIALRPSFGWTVASITSCAYFLAWWSMENTGRWGYGYGTAALIWSPVLLAMLLQNRALPAWLIHALKHRPSPRPSTIGIVIPTLNSGPSLPRLVEKLRGELGTQAPLVIADAGYATFQDIPDARVIKSKRGRGNQIAAGIAAIESEWILIVHADATPRDGWQKSLMRGIHAHPGASMFVFGQRFDHPNLGTTIIEVLNEARVLFGGVAFGDQTMVVNRTALAACGGFPAQPLMEDVEASLLLATKGKTAYLGHEWVVSSVKLQHNLLRRIVLVLRLVSTYQVARLRGPESAKTWAERLYGEYYPKQD